MKKKKITLGMDIGGTNTSLGFVEESGNYLFGGSIPTNANGNIEEFLQRLEKEVNGLLHKNGSEYDFMGIGVAAPSANYFNGTIDSPSNLKWGNVNIVEMIHNYFEIPIVILNDANAAAIGEKHFGSAKELKNFVVVTLGTGLGSGIVVDGNLLFGEGGLAGEFGHTIINSNGRLCNCGRQGCLETYVSVIGLRRTISELLAYFNYESMLRDVPYSKLTGEFIAQQALKGDQIALKAFDYTGEELGRSLANLTACFAIEAVILCGGLLKAGNLILEPTRKYFEKYLLKIHKDKIQIVKSNLKDGMAAVLGASKVILDEIKGQPYLKRTLPYLKRNLLN